MSHLLDREKIQKQEALEKRRADMEEEIFKSDVQAVMDMLVMRRVLARFFEDVDLDGSPFNTNAMAQSRAIGLQDAARWWLNVIREYCPEREAQIRKDAAAMRKRIAKDTTGDEQDEH